MPQILKYAGMTIGGVVVIVAGALVILPKVITPDQFRDEITQIIYDHSGLTIDIKGSMGWSIFPWVGLSLDDIAVSANQVGSLAKLTSASVNVKLLPLLSKRVEISKVKLDGLALTLQENKNGENNWTITPPPQKISSGSKADTQKAPSAEKTITENKVPADTAAQDKLNLKLDIAGVEVTNLLVGYDNQQSGEFYKIKNASLITSALNDKTPFTFELKAHAATSALALDAALSGTAAFDLAAKSFNLSQFDLRANPAVANAEKLEMTGNIAFQVEPMTVNGSVKLLTFNPAKLSQQLNIALPPMASSTALTHVNLEAGFKVDGTHLAIQPIKAELDSFHLNGEMSMADMKQEGFQFSFEGNELNLDQYLPPKAVAQASVPVTNTQAPATVQNVAHAPQNNQTVSAAEYPLIPSETLAKLNIQGSLKLASLQAASIVFSEPTVKINAKDGVNSVRIHSDFYQGSIDTEALLNVRKPNQPAIAAVAAIDSVSIQALSQAIPDLASLQGDINAKLDINTKGQYASVLTKNLNGSIGFQIDKGTFLGANFDEMLCEAIAFTRQKKLTTDDWGNSTQFTNLSGSFDIVDGVARNNDLVAALAFMNLKGKGYVDLVDQALDYQISLNISGDKTPGSDSACQLNKNLAQMAWPVSCDGGLGDLSCGVDFKQLVKNMAGIGENRLKQKIEEKLDAPVKNLLNQLLK